MNDRRVSRAPATGLIDWIVLAVALAVILAAAAAWAVEPIGAVSLAGSLGAIVA